MKYKKLNPRAKAPERINPHAAGYDLFACIDQAEIFLYDAVAVIPTGIALEIPEGWHGIIRSTSGSAFRHGQFVLTGTIDSDYRGEIKVIATCAGALGRTIRHGDKIAQIVFLRHESPELVEAEWLDETDRGTDGFGRLTERKKP